MTTHRESWPSIAQSNYLSNYASVSGLGNKLSMTSAPPMTTGRICVR